MAKKNKKNRSKPAGGEGVPWRPEASSSDAVTVAWTVSVTMVVACDLAAIAAHLFLLNNPGQRSVVVLSQLLLFGGGVIGAASLALLPLVYRLRRDPPPTGFTVFAVCAAAAPILAIIARLIQQA